MFEMRQRLFHFLPQGLKRVEVWRVRWQLCHRQPLGVCFAKPLHRLARVITGSIVHHDHLWGRLRLDLEHTASSACASIPRDNQRFVGSL
jgi:hypothetical protein